MLLKLQSAVLSNFSKLVKDFNLIRHEKNICLRSQLFWGESLNLSCQQGLRQRQKKTFKVQCNCFQKSLIQIILILFLLVLWIYLRGTPVYHAQNNNSISDGGTYLRCRIDIRVSQKTFFVYNFGVRITGAYG